MKILLFAIYFIFTLQFIMGQPCKSVKLGMSKAEVLNLVGPPTEIDTIPEFNGKFSSKVEVVWQYGDVTKYGNQRVQFSDEYVSTEVIADGKRYDELLRAWERDEFSEEELIMRIKKLNVEYCK